MLGEWWGDCCPVSSLGLLRREGAELGIFPSEWLRRPPLSPPAPQSSRGQRKAITSLVFVAAQHVGWEGGQKGPLAGSATSVRESRPGWELWQKGHSEAKEPPERGVGVVAVQRIRGWRSAPPSARALGKG